MLGQADGARWFGSEAVLQSWIAFDCSMVGVLVALGFGAGHRAKFLWWLAPCALLTALGDVGLTAWQAAVFLTIHPWNSIHTAAWLVALSGPVVAIVFLLCFVTQFSVLFNQLPQARRTR